MNFQHIGLSTLTMAPTVARLSARGAVFRKPPPTYYDIKVGGDDDDDDDDVVGRPLDDLCIDIWTSVMIISAPR